MNDVVNCTNIIYIYFIAWIMTQVSKLKLPAFAIHPPSLNLKHHNMEGNTWQMEDICIKMFSQMVMSCFVFFVGDVGIFHHTRSWNIYFAYVVFGTQTFWGPFRWGWDVVRSPNNTCNPNAVGIACASCWMQQQMHCFKTDCWAWLCQQGEEGQIVFWRLLLVLFVCCGGLKCWRERGYLLSLATGDLRCWNSWKFTKFRRWWAPHIAFVCLYVTLVCAKVVLYASCIVLVQRSVVPFS